MPDIRKGTGAPRPSSPSAVGPASVDPVLGKTISGRYLIKSLIARGGMGRVYKAEQVPLGRVCAVKVLNPVLPEDVEGGDFHKRFFLEASTAAKLSHPNTVTIFDYGQSEELYYIAMEYLEGRTLQRVLLEQGALPEARAANIARQVCRSLREAHELGVVHRDLKPGNVLLRKNDGDDLDHVKVLDFGLVKNFSGTGEKDLTETGVLMGSPKYMAPEQIVGGAVSPATDVYSLGVVLYEMLTGKVPFDRAASFVILSAHVHEAPPKIADVNPDVHVSPPMEAIVLRCLEKDPKRRFASMNDVLTALKSLDADTGQLRTGVPAPPPSWPGMAPPASPSGTGTAEPPTIRISGMPAEAIADPTTVDRPRSVDSIHPAPPADTEMIDFRRSSRRRFASIAIGAALGVGVAAAVTLSLQTRGAGPAPSAPPEPSAPVASAPLTGQTTPASTARAPEIRRVTVESTPAGATVLEGGKELCPATPCEVTWEGDAADPAAVHQLSIEKRGLLPFAARVEAGQERVSAALEPPRARGGDAQKPAGGYKPSPY